MAVQNLAELGSPRVARRLEAVLLDVHERFFVRSAAAEALARIRDPASFDVLRGALTCTGLDPEVKVAIIEALCSFSRRDAAVQAITSFASDDDLIVAAVARTRMEKLCGD
jgi:HEAT repeat protein